MPSDVSFCRSSPVCRKSRMECWCRISGSHHIFKRPNGRIFVVPVHSGRVKYVYYRQIKTIIEEGD